MANLRRDDTHQLTTRLVREFDTIVIEDLHVAGMVRNRRLARRIADAGWAEIRRQLTYKTHRAGARLIVAERWFASSKTCPGCGTAKAKLPLSERTFACLACGTVLDRDENAARNLAALAAVVQQPALGAYSPISAGSPTTETCTSGVSVLSTWRIVFLPRKS